MISYKKIMNLYRKLPIEIKASFVFLICSVFQKGILFLTSPIYIRIMSPTEYGDYNVYMSWMNLLSIIITLNLQAGVFNNALHKFADNRDEYVSTMQGLSLILFVIFFILIFNTRVLLCKEIFNFDTSVLYLILAYILFLPSYNFAICKSRFEYRYRTVLIITIVSSLFSLLLGFSFANFAKDGNKAFAALLGYVLVQVTIGLIFMIVQYIKGKKFYSKYYWKYALSFNVPLIPHYLSIVILAQADRIMIARLCGSIDAGKYSFIYNIGSIISLFVTTMNQVLVPWLYRKFDNQEFDNIITMSGLIFSLLGMIVFLIVGIAPEIVRILGTFEYLDSVYLAFPIVFGVYFTAIYNQYATIEFYFEKNLYIMFGSILGSILNIILNYIFIQLYGYTAAAYTTLICYFIFAFGHYLLSRKLSVDRWGQTDVYGVKNIILVTIFFALISFATVLLYQFIRIRYVVLIITLLLFLYYFYKNNIIFKLIKLFE